MTNSLALVTGASAGIGKALAEYHASKGGDLIIVARRKETMEKLKEELEKKHEGVKVHVIALDLGTPDGAQKLYDDVKKSGLGIDILINNAGFGGQGSILERELDDDLKMIQLNVSSLVALCHLFGADMSSREKGGKILNVGSVAGFCPGPNQATYFATKAFVKSFSQAIDQELRSKGVTCTVLCPGYVETEFAKVANLENTDMVKQAGNSAATPESVAKVGYDAMMDGKLVTINEYILSFLMNWMIPLLPRRMVLSMIQKNQANIVEA